MDSSSSEAKLISNISKVVFFLIMVSMFAKSDLVDRVSRKFPKLLGFLFSSNDEVILLSGIKLKPIESFVNEVFFANTCAISALLVFLLPAGGFFPREYDVMHKVLSEVFFLITSG